MADKGILTNDELLALIKKGGGGGGGGTTNYNDLDNLPQINGNVLTGNKTSADLGINTLSADVQNEVLIFS